MNNYIYASENETLDQICWQHYQKSSGIVEKVLEANPHLYDLPAELPIGTEIYLPDIATKKHVNQKIIQLWD